jgi:dienelactone hydrolase
VCNPGDLVNAFKDFGKHSRTPTLWLYAENDKFFWPELAQKFDEAFRSKGARDQFVRAPAVGEDGHALFRHVADWSATEGGAALHGKMRIPRGGEVMKCGERV